MAGLNLDYDRRCLPVISLAVFNRSRNGKTAGFHSFRLSFTSLFRVGFCEIWKLNCSLFGKPRFLDFAECWVKGDGLLEKLVFCVVLWKWELKVLFCVKVVSELEA